jgi:ABC-type lipoprotein release transport system permease subunit
VNGQPVVERVAPVYLARVEIAGNTQNVFGIRAADFPVFRGKARMKAGRLPDAEGRFARWIAGESSRAADAGDVLLDVPPAELAKLFASHDGLQMAIDDTLATQLNKRVGDTLYALGHWWTISGVYESGAVTRAIAPLESLQFLCGSRLDRATLLFLQIRDATGVGPAAAAIRETTRASVVPTSEYQARLMQNFGIMYTYVDAVNAVALIIAFLFIMVTLYTMVLQRTREIAILKSMGAGPAFLLRQVLAESFLLTAAGCAAGIAGSFAAGWGIKHLRPDLTVAITGHWIGIALIAAAIGGLLAGLYPAWQAIRVDVAETLGSIE